MSYDPKCHELAEDFLNDCLPGVTAPAGKIDALAQAIQDVIEDHCRDFERECICTAPPAHSASLEPPEVRRNRACPLHGDLCHTDPDRARDEEMDR